MMKSFSQSPFTTRAAKILSLNDLPPPAIAGGIKSPSQMVRYFQQLCQHAEDSTKRCLLLPSVSSLAKHFNVTPMDIRQALSMLKQSGYDNLAGGLYGHITLWY